MTKSEYLEKQKREALEVSHKNVYEWITVEELQAKLKVSRATVYRWVNKGVLRAYRLESSRYIFFLNSEVDRFLSLNPIAPSGRLDKLGLAINSINCPKSPDIAPNGQ